MRTKDTKPRIGDRDKKIATQMFAFYFYRNKIPDYKYIAKKNGFTRQAGIYYLNRMVSFGVIGKKHTGEYRFLPDMPKEFKNLRKIVKSALQIEK